MSVERIIELTPEIMEAIKSLGSEFYKLTRKDGEFDPQWFLSIWSKALESGIGSLWIYRTVGDEIGGLLGATLSPCIFSGLTVATEAFWFVSEKCRGGTGGIRLFMEFEKWAREIQVDRIQMACIPGLMEIPLEEFYLKHGFSKLETLYCKEVIS